MALKNLSGIFNSMGRHADALVMGEESLDFISRAMPENHPLIGVRAMFMCDCMLLIVTPGFCLMCRRSHVQSRHHLRAPGKEG